MKQIFTEIGAYAGELLIASIAVFIRSIEKKIIIRKNRKKWEAGETFSKIEKK